MYFALAHPGATITSLECDAALCEAHRANLAAFGITGVEVVNAAAWVDDSGVQFSGLGDDAGCVCADGGCYVRSVRVTDLIAEGPVDLLKIDIEGAEFAGTS